MMPVSISCAPGITATLPAFIRLLAWCLLCAGMPVLLHLDQPKPGTIVNASSDTLDLGAAIAGLRATKPEYIGIGNSMLRTRLDSAPPQLDEMSRLTGHKFSFILRGGATTAVWYLTLKNLVAASGIHPRLVFFFFRDTELTSPYTHTRGEHATYLGSLRGTQEPVLDDLLQEPSAGNRTPEEAGTADLSQPLRARDGFFRAAVNYVSQWLNGPAGLYHFSARPERMRTKLTNLAIKIGSGGAWKDRDHQVLSERFSLERLRADVPGDLALGDSANDDWFDRYEALSTDYVNPEARSFLPAMMQVAREHGIKLLFFRVKRRPQPEGVVSDKPYEPDEMRGYVQRLQRWIEERGGLFFDETYDPAIRLEAYNDGDHIGEEHRDWYRKYFWQRMSSIFP